MSDWSSRDHVTLPNSKWRQHLQSLFIPVERRLIGALYELQMHVGYFYNSLDFLLSFFTYSCGIRFLRCSRFRRFTGFNFGSRRSTMFLKKAESLERTAFVHSSMQQINKTLWVYCYCYFFTEKVAKIFFLQQHFPIYKKSLNMS